MIDGPLMEELVIRGQRKMSQEDARVLEKTVHEVDPQLIVEIGSCEGVSSLVFGHALRELGHGGHLICIEPKPRGRWHQNMDETNLRQTVSLVQASSPWVDIGILPGPIDYLLIDGNHKTRWCMSDFHFWSPSVRPGGMIAFHDTLSGGNANQVNRAIDIIMETDSEKLTEIDRSTKGPGVTVFRWMQVETEDT